MKLSRRGAMGVGIGGAIAGPGMAKQAMMAAQQAAQSNKINTPPLKYQGAQVECDSVGSTLLKKEDEIKRLTKLAAGDFSDLWQGREYEGYIKNNKRNKRDLHIDMLKSVSESHKSQMKFDLVRDETKKEWMQEAKNQLELIAKRGLHDLLG